VDQKECLLLLSYNHAEFHPDPTRNDGALGFFDEQQQQLQQ